jgi:hypothetical protein
VKHTVDAGHRSGGGGPVVSATRPQEVCVEVVNVRGGEFGQVEVAKVRPQVALDDRARVAHGGGGPPRRRRVEPLVKQLPDRARPDPSSAGLGH